MTDKVTFITVDEIEHAIIDRGNGEYTSMYKTTYDEQRATSGTIHTDSQQRCKLATTVGQHQRIKPRQA